jgi:hypothetical protein
MENRAQRLRAATGNPVDRSYSLLPRTARQICGLTADRSLRDFARCFIEPLELRRLLDGLPPWITAASTAASWNATTLTVTGPVTITADPGTNGSTSEPIIQADGPAAQILVNYTTGGPTSGGSQPVPIHLGGLSLANGASMEVESAGSVRTTTNYYVLVLGTPGATTAPLFNIDPSSTLDLTDNDLIDLYGTGSSPFSTIQTDINQAADGGAWDQPGLTSSVAGDNPYLCGLGYAEASTLGFSTFDGITTGNDAVVVKYTLLGDADLLGEVGLGDYNAVLSHYGSGTDWTQGDFHYAGVTGYGDYDDVLSNYGDSVAATADLPTGLLVTPDTSSPQTTLHLSWQSPNDGGGSCTYTIYSGNDDGNGSELTPVDSNDITWTSATSCIVSGLAPGTLNYFSVYATNDSTQGHETGTQLVLR